MKITKTELRQIIKEELKTILDETELSEGYFDDYGKKTTTPAPGDEDHWAHSEKFVHPNNRGPMDKHERRARQAWEIMMDKRDWGDKRPFPGDVEGGTGFTHGLERPRTYGGRY